MKRPAVERVLQEFLFVFVKPVEQILVLGFGLRGCCRGVSTAVSAWLPNTVNIFGETGSLHLAGPWHAAGVEGGSSAIELRRFGKETQTIDVAQDKWLYEIEADHVADCVARGLTESPLVPMADTLGNMRALDAELPLIQLYAVGATASVALASTYAFGIGPNAAEVTPALVELTHALGLAIHPYTINSEADLAAMAALCVDGLFTNFPDRYRQVLASSDYDCPPPIR